MNDQIENNRPVLSKVEWIELVNPEFFRPGHLKKQSQFASGLNWRKLLLERVLWQ